MGGGGVFDQGSQNIFIKYFSKQKMDYSAFLLYVTFRLMNASESWFQEPTSHKYNKSGITVMKMWQIMWAVICEFNYAYI